MNTWESWSDLELNIAIGVSTGFVEDGFADKSNCMAFFDGNKVMRLSESGYSRVAVKDYCNSWAAMGPIIVENSITINYDTCQAHVGSYFAPAIKVSVTRSKALRAAAIVYLRMKGVNHNDSK